MPVSAIEMRENFAFYRQVKQVRREVGNTSGISGHIQVEYAIVVKIPEPGGKAAHQASDFKFPRHISKSPIAVVAIQAIGFFKIGHVQIGPAIAIVIAPNYGFGITEILHACFCGNVCESAIAIVTKKLTGGIPQQFSGFVPDIQIDIPVIVVIPPGGCLGRIMHVA